MPRPRRAFSVPETQFLKAPARPGPDARFPLVVRPAVAAEEQGGRLVTAGAARTCADAGELDRSPGGVRPRLLADGAAPAAGNRRGRFRARDTGRGVVAWSAHRRIRMMNPAGSGSSACISIPVGRFACARRRESMLTRLEWSGLFMLELLRDGDGKRWFVELNGRAWGSMALARAVGLEYPAWAVAQAFGERLGEPSLRAAAMSRCAPATWGARSCTCLPYARAPLERDPLAFAPSDRARCPFVASRRSRLQLAARRVSVAS